MKSYPTHITRHRIRIAGFTLTELLVTILIIAVLAAVGFMGVSKWQMKARAVGSVTKVREIGASVMVYATDRGELPVWHDYNQGKYWWQLLSENESGTDVDRFKSPGHRQFDRENPAQTLSYGWNYPVIGRHKGDSGFVGDHVLRLANFSYPEETLVLADGPAENSWGYIDPHLNKPDPNRYEGKAAAAFLDGSARMLNTPTDFMEDSKWFKPVRELIHR